MAKKIGNPEHERLVVRRLYRDALELDWEAMGQRAKSAQYGAWLEDHELHPILDQWMTPDEARVWIKDGPMKEFARAMAGIGAFSEFLDAHPRGPEQVVKAALGEEWSAILDSLVVKPLGCRAATRKEEVFLFWGPARDAKHLLWASLERTVLGRGADGVHCAILQSVKKPIRKVEEERLRRMFERCKVPLRLIRF